MQTNVKPFAEIKGTVKENNIVTTYVGNSKPSDNLGMIDGWKSPMFTNQRG